MGEHSKIVVEHFPVDRLPDELRQGLEPGMTARIVIEPDDVEPRRRKLSHLLGCGRGVYTEEEAVSVIRKLRDE